MSDIHLYWWSIEAATVTATRASMAPLAARLGTQDLRDAHASAFQKSVAATTSTYYDTSGRGHELHADIVRKTREFITANVIRVEDRLRMAELKFFHPRRAGNGKAIPGSHDLRLVLRNNLTDDHILGVQGWLSLAERAFEKLVDEVPVPTLRKMCRDVAQAHGVPIIGRGNPMYFCYEDDKSHFDDLLDVLNEATSGAVVATLAVDDTSDRTILAASADHHLSTVLIDLMNPPPSTRSIAAKTLRGRVQWAREQHERHERRLRTRLDLTRSTILQADQWVADVIRNGGLRSVNNQ